MITEEIDLIVKMAVLVVAVASVSSKRWAYCNLSPLMANQLIED